MSNTTIQSVSTITTNNKENNMITVQQVKTLLNKYKEVQQEGVELQATLDNHKALEAQAKENDMAILRRVLQINDAIKVVEANNNSLQKAVEAKGNVQAVINTQKECFTILDEIEEMMTSPEKVGESIVIAECKEALQKVEETRETLVVPTECNTVTVIQAGEKVTALLSALKQPVERPIIKKGKKVKVNAEPAKSESPERQAASTVAEVAASTVAEVAETVTTVETVTVVNNPEPQGCESAEPETEAKELTEKEKTEKFFEELAKAEETQQEIIEAAASTVAEVAASTVAEVAAATVTTKEFPTSTHELPDGTVIDWKEAALSEIVIAVDEEGNNLTEDIIDFLEEFLGDENFDASEPYSFEMHQQFRKGVLKSPQIKEVPFIGKTAMYVHYLIKSFYCTNAKAVNPLSERTVLEAETMLKECAYLEGCALEPSNCF